MMYLPYTVPINWNLRVKYVGLSSARLICMKEGGKVANSIFVKQASTFQEVFKIMNSVRKVLFIELYWEMREIMKGILDS